MLLIVRPSFKRNLPHKFEIVAGKKNPVERCEDRSVDTDQSTRYLWHEPKIRCGMNRK